MTVSTKLPGTAPKETQLLTISEHTPDIISLAKYMDLNKISSVLENLNQDISQNELDIALSNLPITGFLRESLMTNIKAYFNFINNKDTSIMVFVDSSTTKEYALLLNEESQFELTNYESTMFDLNCNRLNIRGIHPFQTFIHTHEDILIATLNNKRNSFIKQQQAKEEFDFFTIGILEKTDNLISFLDILIQNGYAIEIDASGFLTVKIDGISFKTRQTVNEFSEILLKNHKTRTNRLLSNPTQLISLITNYRQHSLNSPSNQQQEQQSDLNNENKETINAEVEEKPTETINAEVEEKPTQPQNENKTELIKPDTEILNSDHSQGQQNIALSGNETIQSIFNTLEPENTDVINNIMESIENQTE